jgi:hypothetical protein
MLNTINTDTQYYQYRSKHIFHYYATFLRLRRECHIRNLPEQIAIWTNSYKHPTQFDLFQTSSKFSLTWVGVHSLQSLGCSQQFLILVYCTIQYYTIPYYTILYYTILYDTTTKRTSAMSQSVA